MVRQNDDDGAKPSMSLMLLENISQFFLWFKELTNQLSKRKLLPTTLIMTDMELEAYYDHGTAV